MNLIQSIIAFCERTGTKPKQIASKKLDTVFGKSAVGKQLRRDLMVVVNNYYNPETHQCKEYKINWPVYQDLLKEYTQSLNLDSSTIKLSTDAVGFDCVSQELEREHGEELTSGNFKYLRKGHRYYHALQNLPKKTREQIFADHGYRWDYDIEAAMPTLIKQYAQQRGLVIPTPYYDDFLLNRNDIRNQIAQDLGITKSQAKVLLTSLINGAKVALSNGHNTYAIHELLEDETDHLIAISRIVAITGCDDWDIAPHPWISGFRDDINTIWFAIKQAGAITRKFKDISYERVNKDTGEIYEINYTKELPLSSKQKAFLYQMLEHQVMYSVRNYLELNYIKYYQIHDGMMTDKQIDTNELIDYIKKETGFSVRFQERLMEQTSDYIRGICMHMHTQPDIQSSALKRLLNEAKKQKISY
jgi:hypothetical protein